MNRKSHKEEYLLAALVFLTACVAAIFLYVRDRRVFLYFGDAASHIVKSRILIDSLHVPLESIGPVWLPLPHFLLLPFVALDALFYSGIAGAMLGVLCLVGTALLLFAIVRRTTGSRPIAFLSASVFTLNPNVVYLALTPMSELPLFFFFTLGGYALLRWITDGSDKWLALAATAVALSTLCRYEAWLLVPVVAVIALHQSVAALKSSERGKAIKRILIAVLSVSGVLLWLCWNAYEFGDPLRFAPWNFRAGPFSVNNPIGYRQEAAPVTLVKAIVNIFGPVVLLLCLGGLVRVHRTLHGKRYLWLVIYLALPPLFIIITILADLVLIDQWWWNWRFLLTLGPFLAVIGGVGLSELFDRMKSITSRGVVVATLVSMLIVQLTVPSVSVATYADAAKIFSGPNHLGAAFGERLGSMHREGTIVLLAGPAMNERIMLSSSLPLRTFRAVVFPAGEEILGPLRAGDRYVVIRKAMIPETREAVRYWLARREVFLRYYDVVFEDEEFLLLESRMH